MLLLLRWWRVEEGAAAVERVGCSRRDSECVLLFVGYSGWCCVLGVGCGLGWLVVGGARWLL